MAIGGAKPKPPGQSVTRVPQKFEWLEVPDVPNPRPRPMPMRRPHLVGAKWTAREWPAGCEEKWAIWSRMPHTIHWTDTEWDRAGDALHAAARAMECQGDTKWALEQAKYEKAMGTYRDALLDLRIRYTQPVVADAAVTSIDDYRDLA